MMGIGFQRVKWRVGGFFGRWLIFCGAKGKPAAHPALEELAPTIFLGCARGLLGSLSPVFHIFIYVIIMRAGIEGLGFRWSAKKNYT